MKGREYGCIRPAPDALASTVRHTLEMGEIEITDLFDPGRHEGVTTARWSERVARSAVDAIVSDCLAAFTPEGLWPAHELDEPDTPQARYSMLYLGAGGVIWALRRLARLGFVDEGRLRFTDVIPTLVDRNRAVGATRQGGTASFLMGDSGLLLLQWQARPSLPSGSSCYVVRSQWRRPCIRIKTLSSRGLPSS